MRALVYYALMLSGFLALAGAAFLALGDTAASTTLALQAGIGGLCLIGLGSIIHLLEELARSSSVIIARLATEPPTTHKITTRAPDYTVHAPTGRMAYRVDGQYYATMDDALEGRNPLPG